MDTPVPQSKFTGQYLDWTYGNIPNAYLSKPGPPLGHSDHLKTSEAITNNCSDPTSSAEQLNSFLTRFNDRSTPTNWTCPTLRWDCGDRPSVGCLCFYPSVEGAEFK